MKILALYLVLTLFYSAESTVKVGSIILNDGKFTYKDGIVEGSLAFGSYNDSVATTGWGVLNITAKRYHDKYTADQIMFAAGMLEGALSSDRIYQHYQNLEGFLFDNRPPDTYSKICSFLTNQTQWMKTQIGTHKDDTFWVFVSFMQSQLEGLYAGYQITADKKMRMCQVQILSAIGDLIDLLNVFKRKPQSYFENLSRTRLRRYVESNGHCSALIKVTPGYENLYMAHNSWFVYSSMLRIYKHYNFEVFKSPFRNTRMSFSSYPGFLCSLDDFYILGSGMVMLQTTNNIFNTSLYDQVVPQSLLAWQRVRVANALATDGEQWSKIVSKYNSGTYNNQYMIMDLKRFTPNVGFKDGALWVVEQIPGLVEYSDQTPILREGYWASYNVPFYETIFNISGYAALARRNPDNSHDLAPRAKIFRRDQSSVKDMVTMKRLMRFNNFKHDPYSEFDACNSICCRGDLKFNPSNMGCYDTKVTDYFLALNFTSFAVSGPTVGGDSELPPFRWTRSMPHHMGMPDVFNFSFVTMKPEDF